MNRAFLVASLGAVSLLSSCSYYDHRTKQLFYNEISSTNDSLDKMTADWHQALNRSVVSKNFSGLAPLRTRLSLFVSKHRAAIADIEVPEKMDALRDSEEVFLSTQSAVIADAYPAFEPYNDITPDGDIQNQLKSVVNDEATESAGSAAIRKSLAAFAQKNTLKTLPPIK